MKTALVFLMALAIPLAAKDVEPGAAKITVNFPNWQNYTDIKDAYIPTDSGEQNNLHELEKSLQEEAHYLVPDGDHLTLTFSDIDLAGEYEPQRGTEWEDVRILKEIYPPHYKFTWQLTNSAGQVVRQGKEDLTDLNYQMMMTPTSWNPLRYDKAELRNWMQRALK